MPINFTLESAGVQDGPIVNFGPFDAESGTQQSIPSALKRRVVYLDLEIALTVDCVFTGDKIEIQKLTVENDGKFISTKVLTQLALPAVMRAIAVDVVPNSHLWAFLDNTAIIKNEAPSFLAQVYWFEHISWGSPRGSIMNYMGWSRTNANFHISKIARRFPLPGAHSLENKNKQNSASPN